MAAATYHPSRTWMEWDETQLLGCPHCLGLPGSCHVCHVARRVSYPVALRSIQWAWATAGCGCQACQRAGDPPARTAEWEAA